MTKHLKFHFSSSLNNESNIRNAVLLYYVTMSPAHEIEAYEEMEVELHASSALDGNGHVSRSGRFIA